MGKLIISEGIEEQFKTATKNKQDTLNKLPESTRKKLGKHVIAGGGASGQSASMVEPFFSPFIQRTTVEIPKDLKQLNTWRRYWYRYEPIVSAACGLHVDFAMSTFDITHEDPYLQKEFQAYSEDIDLFNFVLDMLLEHFVVGEAFPFAFFDDINDPHTIERLVLLDPDLVDVKWDPLSGKDSHEEITLEPSQRLKAVVSEGSSNTDTGEIYDQLPQDIRDICKNGGKIQLPGHQVYHLKRKADYFKTRGISVIDGCMKLLLYKDKAREAQYAILDRHVTPKEIYTIGSDAYPTNNEEIQAFKELLQSQWNQPNQAIIWHHALNVKWEGANGKVLNLDPEFRYIDKQLSIALLINEGTITAERQPYASTSVGLDVMIQRYLTLRMRVEKFLKQFVFGTICLLNDIRKPTQAQLSHRIRIVPHRKDSNLWTPNIRWNKENLRDDLQKLRFISDLVGKDLLPPATLYSAMNLNEADIKQKLKEEAQRKKKEGVPSPLPGGMPMPTGGEGEMMPSTELPTAPIAETPRGRPPESVKNTALPVGI